MLISQIYIIHTYISEKKECPRYCLPSKLDIVAGMQEFRFGVNIKCSNFAVLTWLQDYREKANPSNQCGTIPL